MITNRDAVLKLCEINHPNSGIHISGKCESDLSGVKLLDDSSLAFTFDDVLAKKAELQSEWDAQAYARTRKPLYPDIGDQLDDLYKKGAFSDEMAAKIKKVKDDNPKPS
tara:strand:+ start:253 stop:579 length:327 start_codon:yes stop_codon:yes gene_type:complete